MRTWLLSVVIVLDFSSFIAAAPPETRASADALKSLRAALDGKPSTLTDVIAKDFTRVPLTKEDAKTARELLWQWHVAMIQKERAAEIKNRVLTDGQLTMPIDYKIFGKKPPGGRSLWISLHGGGGTTKEINDQQWQNQKRLYTIEEGIYLCPRAPTNTWNLWHEGHIDRMFGRLIEDLIVLEEVNPERVFLLGYSAGGDGVYQMAPRMADYWAGAAMMAGSPNGVSLLSVRNVAFALQVGGKDDAYGRNQAARTYGATLEKYHKEDPKGYTHFFKMHEDKGHWMKLEDKIALPWMAKYTRPSVPDKVVWKQTGLPHDRSYWLAVPAKEAKGDSLAIVTRDGPTFDILTAEKIGKLSIRIDERMTDLDQPVTVTRGGKKLFSGVAPRTMSVLIATLQGRGDPQLMFDAEVSVDLSTGK